MTLLPYVHTVSTPPGSTVRVSPRGCEQIPLALEPRLSLAPPVDPRIVTLHAGWARRIGVPLFFWTAGFFAAALATGAGHREAALRIGAAPAIIGALFGVALWRRRAVLGPEAVEVRGLLRTQRLRFADLTAFTYDARSYRLYLPIPIGRVARLSLRGRRSHVVFHAGFAQFDRYAPTVVAQAVEATVQRMRAEIDRGERTRFGRWLSLDRTQLHVRSLLRRRTIRIQELRLDVADGTVFIAHGRERVGSFSLARTPNLFALPQLVEELAANAASPRPDALRQALVLAS